LDEFYAMRRADDCFEWEGDAGGGGGGGGGGEEVQDQGLGDEFVVKCLDDGSTKKIDDNFFDQFNQFDAGGSGEQGSGGSIFDAELSATDTEEEREVKLLLEAVQGIALTPALRSARDKLQQGKLTPAEFVMIRKADDSHHVEDLKGQAQEFYRGLSMADFSLLRMLGKGAFGTVLLCELKTSAAVLELEDSTEQRFFAIKVLQKLDMSSYIKHRTVLEKKVMERVNHNYIASLSFAFQSPDKLYLGMPFFQGGDLFHHLAKARANGRAGLGFRRSQVRVVVGLRLGCGWATGCAGLCMSGAGC
jgi:hypothetical protein